MATGTIQVARKKAFRVGGRRAALRVMLVLGAALAGGCAPQASFSLNTVYLRIQEKPLDEKDKQTGKVVRVFHYRPQHLRDISDILVGLFGTPDEPHFPALPGLDAAEVVDLQRLRSAAGPVGTDPSGNPRGLYRRHCAHCHGITGDGAGPTATFLNPYPRDYRKGIFKFKSTPKGERPTHEDLKRILINGIPNTAMPSFRLLSEPELESLVHYVKYLSIRGEVERRLMEELGELEEGDRLIDLAARGDGSGPYAAQIGRIVEIVTEVVERWQRAAGSVTEVPPPPAGWDADPSGQQEAIIRGRELFYGKLDCKKCHGDAALGDSETTDYNDWTKEWANQFNLDPADPVATREFLLAGAHRPRPVRPRNLRLGVYRGGRRPVDLYWRVRNGIDGTPMPAVPANVPPEDVWAVVQYVRQLPYESISRPGWMKENVKEIR